jgi:hypothetical protein
MMRYTGLGEALIYSVRGEPFDSAQKSLVEALLIRPIREFVRAELVEALPFDKLRANGLN